MYIYIYHIPNPVVNRAVIYGAHNLHYPCLLKSFRRFEVRKIGGWIQPMIPFRGHTNGIWTDISKSQLEHGLHLPSLGWPKRRPPTWLVGGLVAMFDFPRNIGLLIIPIDELIFFRGVAKNHQPDDLCPVISSQKARDKQLPAPETSPLDLQFSERWNSLLQSVGVFVCICWNPFGIHIDVLMHITHYILLITDYILHITDYTVHVTYYIHIAHCTLQIAYYIIRYYTFNYMLHISYIGRYCMSIYIYIHT